jgi:hypothetical protein
MKPYRAHKWHGAPPDDLVEKYAIGIVLIVGLIVIGLFQ